MKKMKTNRQKQKKRNKQSLNIYAWGQKNKKVFAAIICLVLVLGLVISLVQV